MRKIILLFSVLIVPLLAVAQDNDLSQNFNKVSLASVYDGDTIRVQGYDNRSLYFFNSLGQETRVNLVRL